MKKNSNFYPCYPIEIRINLFNCSSFCEPIYSNFKAIFKKNIECWGDLKRFFIIILGKYLGHEGSKNRILWNLKIKKI